MPTFATESGFIAYEVLEPTEPNASPPSLTLLHNFMSTGRAAWGPLLPVLNRRFRILLPDLPGHGRSIGYPAGWHHWAMARQVAALMRHEGAAAGLVAGCSAGGMIAQLLVHHRMVEPAGLVLVSTTYSTNPQRTEDVKALLPENFLASDNWLEATGRLHDPHQGDGYFVGRLLPGFRALTSAASIDLPLAALAAWRLPVCLIHGERDEFFPLSIAQSMAETLPNARLHAIPNQTHALIFRRPWQVAELMDHFLNQVVAVPQAPAG